MIKTFKTNKNVPHPRFVVLDVYVYDSKNKCIKFMMVAPGDSMMVRLNKASRMEDFFRKLKHDKL